MEGFVRGQLQDNFEIGRDKDDCDCNYKKWRWVFFNFRLFPWTGWWKANYRIILKLIVTKMIVLVIAIFSILDCARGPAGEGPFPGQFWVCPMVQEVFWRQLWWWRLRGARINNRMIQAARNFKVFEGFPHSRNCPPNKSKSQSKKFWTAVSSKKFHHFRNIDRLTSFT